MYGRYGTDQLTNAVLWVYLALFAVNLFVNSPIISLIAMAIIVWSFFRMLSRNVYARNKENLMFLSVKRKFKAFFKLNFDRVRDVRHKVYKKCPHCRAVVRLPRKGGKHSATCPACRSRFSLRIMPAWAIALTCVLIFAVIVAAAVLIVVLF